MSHVGGNCLRRVHHTSIKVVVASVEALLSSPLSPFLTFHAGHYWERTNQGVIPPLRLSNPTAHVLIAWVHLRLVTLVYLRN